MAEVFGAVGTGIAILDLILKRTKTLSRLKNDVKGAASDIARRRKDLELRSQLLESLRADLDPSALKGAPVAVSCLDACAVEIRQLKATLKLFEAQLASGQGWRKVLQAKLEYAWKKEDVEDLYKNVCTADQVFSDALAACQWYLTEAAAQGVNEIRLNDLPLIAAAVQDIRSQDLPPISDALRDIRTQDLPAITTALSELRSQELQSITDSIHESRTQDLPAISRNITSALTSNTGHVVRLLGAEGQHTRDTIIERGRMTSTEMGNLRSSFRQMLMSNNGVLESTLLPPIQQHLEGFTEIVIQELRTSQGRTDTSTTSRSSQSTFEQSESSSQSSFDTSGYMRTKHSAMMRWERKLPVGLGTISLRRETKQRILLRIRKYMTERDTSIDTETIYTLGFVPNAWLFSDTITGCNWRFSFKTTRRIDNRHPVWEAIEFGDINAIIGYFQDGSISINDVNSVSGDSLLHVATSGAPQNAKVGMWLVENGIDPHIANDSLQTAVFGLRNIIGGDQYHAVTSLLIETCQLDPNDKDLNGQSVLEQQATGTTDFESFGRLLSLSLPLSTEPEGRRIQDLFHSSALTSYIDGVDALGRMKYLLDEYSKLKLPEQGEPGRKWWHTADFLWTLAQIIKRSPFYGDSVTAGYSHELLSREWIEDQTCDVIRSGVDLHSKRNNETLLDFFLGWAFRPNLSDETDGLQAFRWLSLLHKAGNPTIAEYLAEEEALHPGGQLPETNYHYYQEYPIFIILYGSPSEGITLTRGLVITETTVEDTMPGAFRPDPEGEFCKRQGLQLAFRDIRRDERVRMTERPEKIVARYLTRDPEEDSTVIEDWHLSDGRKGAMYPLYSISTALFDRGDYGDSTAIITRRDHKANPIYVEYPDDWVTLGQAWDPKDHEKRVIEYLTEQKMKKAEQQRQAAGKPPRFTRTIPWEDPCQRK